MTLYVCWTLLANIVLSGTMPFRAYAAKWTMASGRGGREGSAYSSREKSDVKALNTWPESARSVLSVLTPG
jgi:hypothetical protein